jgi:OHCU decarboxylase
MNLNDLDEAAFVAALDGVVEHSPWVAREAYRRRPFASTSELGSALADAMRDAPAERQVALVRAHPELSSGGPLTAESASEQAGTGLDRGGNEQRALNAAYRERFGFPLVVCVREHTPESILAWGAQRLERTPEEELDTALDEIAKIARLRLEDRPVVQGFPDGTVEDRA